MVGSSPVPWQEKHSGCPASATGISGAGAGVGDAAGVASNRVAAGSTVAKELLAGVTGAADEQAAATSTSAMHAMNDACRDDDPIEILDAFFFASPGGISAKPSGCSSAVEGAIRVLNSLANLQRPA